MYNTSSCYLDHGVLIFDTDSTYSGGNISVFVGNEKKCLDVQRIPGLVVAQSWPVFLKSIFFKMGPSAVKPASAGKLAFFDVMVGIPRMDSATVRREGDHVFSEDRMLKGLDPQRVKVYSDLENCANCAGYFRDGLLVNNTGDKVKGGKVPKEYVFVE